MAKCPNCGEKVEKKLNFCVFCGTNLKTGEKTLANELEDISKSKSGKSHENSNYVEPVSYNPPPAPKIPPAPVNQVRYKSSVVSPAGETAENTEPAVNTAAAAETAPIPSFENGFNTGEIENAPAMHYETNVLIEENNVETIASPVITEIEGIDAPVLADMEASVPAEETVNEEVYEQSENAAEEVTDDEAASAVSDIEAAFANLGSMNTAPVAPVVEEEQPAVEITPVEYDEPVQPAVEITPVEYDEPVQAAEEISAETPAAEESAELKMVSCVGIDSKTAEFMLSKAGIKYELVTRNDDAVRGEIIEQSCPAGEVISPDTVVKIVASCGTWSEWTENEPDSTVNEVESVTKYRTRTREKTIDHKTSVTSEVMNGYNLVNVEKGYGDWAVEEHFTTESRKPSESCEIAENLTGFKYCGWFYKGTSAIERNSCCSIEMALYFNNDTKESDWEYREVISFNNIRETVVAWSPIYEIEMSETPAGDKVKPNIHMVAYKVDGTDYPLKYGSFETQWYKYKSRTINDTTYHFEKEVYTDWSVWSEWTEEAQVATEFMEVEAKVLYRYRTIADEK